MLSLSTKTVKSVMTINIKEKIRMEQIIEYYN